MDKAIKGFEVLILDIYGKYFEVIQKPKGKIYQINVKIITMQTYTPCLSRPVWEHTALLRNLKNKKGKVYQIDRLHVASSCCVDQHGSFIPA